MDFFHKYKIVILRSLGALMLLVGFVIHFWTTPQKEMSANERAAANLARMEAKTTTSSIIRKSPDENKFLMELKSKQEQQMKYLTILAMLFGVGFLGYSFLKKSED